MYRQLVTRDKTHKLTALEKNLPLPGRTVRGGIVREFGMDMYTLLYLKWITNKHLLHSTGNSAQCYVTVWMGEETGEKWMRVYAWLGPLSCSPEAIPTLLSFYVKCESCSVVTDSL